MAKTDDPTTSALIAYDVNGTDSARAVASRLLQNAPVVAAIAEKRKTLKQALIEKGIDEDKIAEKVGVLLDATDEDGNVDYAAVDKGLKHATVIHGVADPEWQQTGSRNTYNFIFSGEVRGKVREIEGHIKDMLTKKPNAQ